MSASTALLVRDMRLAVLVAAHGARCFPIVVTMMLFAIGPDLALLARIDQQYQVHCSQPLALDCSYDRPRDGSPDLMMGPLPLELSGR